tara:strand:- start:7319 stop:7588 length:270 start_codon:yes stop_codon:yes gene_type:complete
MSLVSLFDPKNEKHVLWLRDVDVAMENTTNGNKIDIVNVIKANPMNIPEINMLDWAFTHFQLCMKYSQGVLRGEGFIPEVLKKKDVFNK